MTNNKNYCHWVYTAVSAQRERFSRELNIHASRRNKTCGPGIVETFLALCPSVIFSLRSFFSSSVVLNVKCTYICASRLIDTKHRTRCNANVDATINNVNDNYQQREVNRAYGFRGVCISRIINKIRKLSLDS